jgi:hypothetical protein
VKFFPELKMNLFTIGKALKNGFNLSNDGKIIIKLSKGNVTLMFDNVVRTKMESFLALNFTSVG